MEDSDELIGEGGKDGEEERDGEEVAVEEVFVPMRAVLGVGELHVETHDGGEELSDEEDGKTRKELGIEGNSWRRRVCFPLRRL